MLQVFFLLLRSLVVGFRSHRDVALENLVLRHQIQVALRSKPNLQLQTQDRLLWVWLRRLWPAWRDHLLIVQPEERGPLAPEGLAPVLDLEVTDSPREASPER